MQWTTDRKVYAAILALAGAGLGIDRLFFSGAALGPGAAIASAPTPLPAPATPGATPAPAASRPAGRTLADAFEALRTTDDNTTDLCLFHSRASWIAPPVKDAPGANATAAPAPPDLRTVLATHRLSTVMDAGPGSFVIIDSKRLGLGEALGDIRLIGVRKSTATFERNAEQVTIDVENPGTPPGDPAGR